MWYVSQENNTNGQSHPFFSLISIHPSLLSLLGEARCEMCISARVGPVYFSRREDLGREKEFCNLLCLLSDKGSRRLGLILSTNQVIICGGRCSPPIFHTLPPLTGGLSGKILSSDGCTRCRSINKPRNLINWPLVHFFHVIASLSTDHVALWPVDTHKDRHGQELKMKA